MARTPEISRGKDLMKKTATSVRHATASPVPVTMEWGHFVLGPTAHVVVVAICRLRGLYSSEEQCSSRTLVERAAFQPVLPFGWMSCAVCSSGRSGPYFRSLT